MHSPAGMLLKDRVWIVIGNVLQERQGRHKFLIACHDAGIALQTKTLAAHHGRTPLLDVLHQGQQLKAEELVRYLEPRMPYFMVPRYIEFVEELPKTPTEKVRKQALREIGVNEKTWDMVKAGIKLKK